MTDKTCGKSDLDEIVERFEPLDSDYVEEVKKSAIRRHEYEKFPVNRIMEYRGLTFELSNIKKHTGVFCQGRIEMSRSELTYFLERVLEAIEVSRSEGEDEDGEQKEGWPS